VDARRVTGRFAPSPTGVLHLGNLRTALLSWCAARSVGGRWLVRMEDLDPVTSSRDHERRQVDDLARLGLESDGEVVRQSERFERYRAAIDRLRADGLVYPCYCTRREIREAATAPHGDGLPEGAYPGTCRELGGEQCRDHERDGRRAALRLRTNGERYTFTDLVLGEVTGAVDDVVLQRNDGVPAYNLAVVVDDHEQGVDQVVRGDDLASSTPRQLHLHHLLGFPVPAYAHVPLVVGPDGSRLAKRHGGITLDDLAACGMTDVQVLRLLAGSIGVIVPPDVTAAETAAQVAAGFDLGSLPREPWRFDPSGDLPR
jgi:glutamyl-tRNA synthetase